MHEENPIPHSNERHHVINNPYRFNVILECIRDSVCVLRVLFRDECKILNLISIVGLEVFERVSEIIRDFS